MFKKKGRVENYGVEINMTKQAQNTPPKSRRVPFQLQDQVDEEIE